MEEAETVSERQPDSRYDEPDLVCTETDTSWTTNEKQAGQAHY